MSVIARRQNGMLAAGALLAVAGLAAGAGAVAVVLASDADHRILEAIGTGVVGWSFIGAGLVALLRRPDVRVGALVSTAGFAWLLGALDESSRPLVYAVGELARPLFIPLTVHVLLGYPSGRLRRAYDRAAAGALYAAVVLLGPARFLVSSEPHDDCSECPRNPLALFENEALLDLLSRMQQLAVALGVASAAALLGWRWWSASRARAPAARPALWAVAATLTYLVALGVELRIDPPDAGEIALILVQIAAAAAVPVVLVAGLLRRGPPAPDRGG